MRESILVACLLLLFILPLMSVSASGNPVSDKREYSEVNPGYGWLDAKSLDVSFNGTYVTFKLNYYGNIPNDSKYSFYTYFYIDADRNTSTGCQWWWDFGKGIDYYIEVGASGDGSWNGTWFWAWNSSLGYFEWKNASEYGVKPLFEPGGSWIGVILPISSLNISVGQTINIIANSWSEVRDYVERSFNYTVGKSNTITVDGNLNDWAGISPVLSDSTGDVSPSEFDWKSFYMTDNGSVLFFRFDVSGSPTKANITDLDINWGFIMYFDTDNNVSTGCNSTWYPANGSEYFMEYYSSLWKGFHEAWSDLWQWNKTAGSWQYVGAYNSYWANWNETFEGSMPFSAINVSSGDIIRVSSEVLYSGVQDHIPDTSNLAPSFASIELSSTGAVLKSTDLRAIVSAGKYVINASTQADAVVEKSGVGKPEVEVKKYISNPVGKTSFKPVKFVDLKVNSSSGLDYLLLKVYYTKGEISGLNESSLRLYWWNGAKWVQCSDTGVNMAENYVWANITSTSTPSLSQLTGTVFGAGGVALPPPPKIYKPTQLNLRYSVSNETVTIFVNISSEEGVPLNGTVDLWTWKQVNSRIYCFVYTSRYSVINGSAVIKYPLHKGLNGFLVSFDPENPDYAPLFWRGGREPIWIKI